MNSTPQAIKEYSGIDRSQFEQDIVQLDQPAVLRGFCKHWPAVKQAQGSIHDFCDYLLSFDCGASAYTIAGEPEIAGRFFYTDDLSGVNFRRAQVNFKSVLEQIVAMRDTRSPHAIAIQSASVRNVLPNFDQSNTMTLLPSSVAPTMWLGNRALVAPHYDVSDNIAVVVYGRRRFTLYPPEQVANLYVGPAMESPGGVPISLVDINAPDYERFPNYKLAQAASMSALLEPGDAIFIPSPWWHAVESLDALNMLVNYWWGQDPRHQVSANNSLMHSMLTIANLPPHKRESWRHFYDYYVFKHSGDAREHLPDELHDVLTTLSDQQLTTLLAFLKSKL